MIISLVLLCVLRLVWNVKGFRIVSIPYDGLYFYYSKRKFNRLYERESVEDCEKCLIEYKSYERIK